MPPTLSPMDNTTPSSDNGKTIAIISYITLIGWIIALIMHGSNKTKLGAFHLRQMLGFMIAGIIAGIVFGIVATILAFIPVVGLILDIVLYIAFVVGMIYLWVMGLLAAVKSEEKPMPLIGAKIQSMFGALFN